MFKHEPPPQAVADQLQDRGQPGLSECCCILGDRTKDNKTKGQAVLKDFVFFPW